MDPQLVAAVINGAFTVINSLRRMGMTADEINARFDMVDAGGEAITVEQVQTKLDDFQAALDAGKEMNPETTSGE